MMNDVIKIIYHNVTQDADGFPVVVRREQQIFADIQSVKRSEFYAAASAKVSVSLVASINYVDYDTFKKAEGKPTHVEYDGDLFVIVRTYRTKKSNSIELTIAEVE